MTVRTKGLSPKIRGSLAAVVASGSSLLTAYIETGELNQVLAGAFATAVFTGVSVYVAGPGEVEAVESFVEISHSNHIGLPAKPPVRLRPYTVEQAEGGVFHVYENGKVFVPDVYARPNPRVSDPDKTGSDKLNGLAP